MARSVELLLLESVENQGIVGDVIKARLGYARNYLLPRNLATEPSDELIKSLQSKRADAQKQVSELRQMRAQTIERLKGFELTVERSCNDQGILYASVTQQEISAALNAAGYAVRPRDIRLSGAIKRVDNYDVHVKYETELETWIKLHIKADRVLAMDERREAAHAAPAAAAPVAPAEGAHDAAQAKSDKHPAGKKDDKHAVDKHAKPEKAHKDDGAKAGKDKKAAAADEEEQPKKASKKPREDAKKSGKDAKKA